MYLPPAAPEATREILVVGQALYNALFPRAGIVARFIIIVSPRMLGAWGCSARRKRVFCLFLLGLDFWFLFLTIIHGVISFHLPGTLIKLQ